MSKSRIKVFIKNGPPFLELKIDLFAHMDEFVGWATRRPPRQISGILNATSKNNPLKDSRGDPQTARL